MTAERQHIRLVERESKLIDPSPLTEEEDGSLVNLEGATLNWRVINPRDGTTVIEKSSPEGIEITEPTGGGWEISLDATDTDGLDDQTYRHEGRLVDADGFESVVTRGRFIVESTST